MAVLHLVGTIVQVDDAPIVARRRETLGERPDTAVIVGTAPDGLPLILSVRRAASVATPVLRALNLDREDLPPRVGAALDELEAAVRHESRKEGLVERRSRPGYLTSATVGTLLGGTLLSRAMGALSPLVIPDDAYSMSSAPASVPATQVGAILNREEIEAMMARGNAARRLFVPIADGAPPAVELEGGRGGEAGAERALVLEDLTGLDGACFHTERSGGEREQGALDDPVAYERALGEAARVAWSVPRDTIGRGLVQLARGVQVHHDQGRVHADLKPDNVLVGPDGPRPIDALDLPAGGISTSFSPGWAAPEQVMARPVAPQTDVYALGLLLARLVEAAIFGEEQTFIVPTGGMDRKRLRVLARPEVFIDPTKGIKAEEPARQAYASLIARCIHFDPEARPASGAAFADALAERLEQHPLPGRLTLTGLTGSLRRNVEVLGRARPAWVLVDTRRTGAGW